MHEAFTQNKIQLKVALTPQQSAAPIEGIKSQLNRMLLKYNDEVGGVPITYTGISFPPGKEYGRILGEHPWIHVDVTTTMLVFQPAVGLTVRGKINKVSDSYMSLLVFGMFNANISEEELAKSYTFKGETNQWYNADDDSALVDGDIVECYVASFQHANGVLSLVCKLMGTNA